jgi:hypothetical protein
MTEASLAGCVAWVSMAFDERDPQRLWLTVLDALRRTIPGSGLVRELSATLDLDGWSIVERLLKDLAPLRERVWLVVDDVHELDSAKALRELELLVLRGRPGGRRHTRCQHHHRRPDPAGHPVQPGPDCREVLVGRAISGHLAKRIPLRRNMNRQPCPPPAPFNRHG